MPIFQIYNNKIKQLKTTNFKNEKELQTLIENNLEEIFGIKFIASEFPTGEKHGGRIDTLGLDENNSPVIIEYKWGESESVINQGLFYLDWLVDHKGIFKLLLKRNWGRK
jgi:RecB family endonuclease NucS